MAEFNVSAVINGHVEGLLLKPSIDSALKAREYAEANGVSVEIIVVLDRPDEISRTVARACLKAHPAHRILEVQNGDLGLSRNDGASAANGDYIAFLDGDDLWGKNWLAAAYNSATATGREVVWHPEVNVYFGGNPHIFLHIDSDDVAFEISGLAYTNYWTALSFVRRDFLLQVPYSRTKLAKQIGYEDWAWNLHTMELGAVHKIVLGTGHAIRTKPPGSSLLSATSAAGCMPSPSKVFLNSLQGRKAESLGKLRIIKHVDPVTG
ncbi:glycosyltransferase family 2 protein [Achromobacter aloeverae]